MRRKPSAADDRWGSPTGSIARGTPATGSSATTTARHRWADVAVAPSVAPGAGANGRTTTHRLVPLAAGAVVMLLASVVASFVQAADSTGTASDLAASLLDDPAQPARRLDPTSTPVPATAAPAAPTTAEETAARRSRSPQPTATRVDQRPAAAPRRPAAPAADRDAEGDQPAAARIRTRVRADELDGARRVLRDDAGRSHRSTRGSATTDAGDEAREIRGGSAGRRIQEEVRGSGTWEEMRARMPLERIRVRR